MKKPGIYLIICMLFAVKAIGQDAQDRFEFPLWKANMSNRLFITIATGDIKVIGHHERKFVVMFYPHNAAKNIIVKKDSIVNGVPKLIRYGSFINMTYDDNTVSLRNLFHDSIPAIDVVIYVPYETNLKLKINKRGNISVKNVKGNLDLNNSMGSIDAEQISGSVVALAYNKPIRIQFDQLSESKPSHITGLNKAVSVWLPPAPSVTLKLKTAKGKIHSDLGAAFSQVREPGKGNSSFEDLWSKAILNGGRANLTIQSRYGNINIHTGDKLPTQLQF
ncbi:MAG TPA: hypothetical protein VD993_07800 [Chitinophagaceae bacterium]|nr:hypothetical protein [Chitinophagaceae bacterium]